MTDTESATRYDSESPREDAATKATREELKQTAISEKTEKKGKDDMDDTDDMDAKDVTTPEQSADADDAARHSDVLIEQIGSPKKKRAHDEVDKEDDDVHHQRSRSKVGDGSDDGDSALDVAVSGAAVLPSTLNVPNGGEPEKKRLRDEEEAARKDGSASTGEPPSTSTAAFASSGFAKLTSSTSPFGSLAAAGTAASGKPSLFGSSSSSSASPFGALGAGGKNATASSSSAKTSTSPALTSAPKLSFGGAAGAPSPFASVSGTAPSKLFGFGGGGGFGSSSGASTSTSTSTFASSTASASPSLSAFSKVGGSVFGSTLGSGPRLTSFAQPGSVLKSGKPAKPFGAPDSDAEESSKGAESDDDAEDENEDDAEGKDEGSDAKEGDEQRPKAGGEEKKKPRLQRVAVNDGEMGEATLIQVRARLYYLDKDEGGWKERGAGMLKLNVPEACVEYDREGNVRPASFDASMMGTVETDEADEADEADRSEDKAAEDEVDLESGGAKNKEASATGAAAPPARSVVRLIMRQDSTHRVILNTVVLAATEFQERQTLKATTVLFTAFEGAEAKPVSIQIKMSAVNSKAFLSAVESVQRELRER